MLLTFRAKHLQELYFSTYGPDQLKSRVILTERPTTGLYCTYDQTRPLNLQLVETGQPDSLLLKTIVTEAFRRMQPP